jgi:hypothetical protein
MGSLAGGLLLGILLLRRLRRLPDPKDEEPDKTGGGNAGL